MIYISSLNRTRGAITCLVFGRTPIPVVLMISSGKNKTSLNSSIRTGIRTRWGIGRSYPASSPHHPVFTSAKPHTHAKPIKHIDKERGYFLIPIHSFYTPLPLRSKSALAFMSFPSLSSYTTGCFKTSRLWLYHHQRNISDGFRNTFDTAP